MTSFYLGLIVIKRQIKIQNNNLIHFVTNTVLWDFIIQVTYSINKVTITINYVRIAVLARIILLIIEPTMRLSSSTNIIFIMNIMCLGLVTSLLAYMGSHWISTITMVYYIFTYHSQIVDYTKFYYHLHSLKHSKNYYKQKQN